MAMIFLLLLLSYLLPVRFIIYLHGNDLLCPLLEIQLYVLYSSGHSGGLRALSATVALRGTTQPFSV